ncbi:6-phospho-beta-glucosidase [Actinoplanes sp. NPDC051411]|uniref:family 4 glycosyl hydrolase n=1 Tax=Actinoplanes sp. NPDC051411 TaxID=3155522 RepID=UPI0034242068
MKLVILGGGGFRVPLVHSALLDPSSPITSLVLHDVDAGRLAAISRVIEAQGHGPALSATTDLTEALTGADFVFSAIRVHGLPGRVIDEKVAIGLGVLGQETTGAGGVSYGLRTVPVADAIARRIALVAPSAWVINFTNPAGLVTEAMAAHLGDRVIGICDSPSALGRRVARALGLTSSYSLGYAGLNHLGWLSSVTSGGVDVLPSLFDASDDTLRSFEEGRLFGPARLRALRAVPNEYLHYYYDTASSVRAEQAAAETRGEFLLRQQTACYDAIGSGDPLAAWTAALRERDATYMSLEGLDRDASAGGGGYEQVALELMRALASDVPASLILNVRNRGALDIVDADAVVEVPCTVTSDGPVPVTGVSVPGHGVALVRRVKATERAVLSAAANGSRAVAVRAMASHPLVDSVPLARALIDAYRSEFPELAYLR